MKWYLSELLKYKNEPFEFSETLDLEQALLADFGDVILAATPMQVTGTARAENEDIIIHASVRGEIVTPSTRSAQPVHLPLDFEIDEVYIQSADHTDRYEIEDSVILVEDDVLDFKQVVMEYIFLQVPLQILAEGEAAAKMPSGEGWEVIAEDEFDAQQANQPIEKHTPMSGLADLFAQTSDDE
ncbi:DUF177 domain-containing protein [Weissella diestrammenae]|uniref:DUF177 domain-containing protein n=1 Tax=Weissella diestrammenae TaxID=1162633 RepID=A0A7G9T689_9LACO|nr:YceD family protein [Weissella diestrammenae]MCM0583341.1 DUF177 domain-containing protein [Weissella diestrammenae]QNN75614.1 DUF177 domain-containing protein [Weissella diestrammenae]